MTAFVDVERWFGEYVDAIGACLRGERDIPSLLEYYGMPLHLTTDGGFMPLTSEEHVVAAVTQQLEGMRAAPDYDHTEVVSSEVTVLNATSALYRAVLSRQRSDGSEITGLTVTYLVTDGPAGRRISALAVHSP